jgi:hypothetical protein
MNLLTLLFGPRVTVAPDPYATVREARQGCHLRQATYCSDEQTRNNWLMDQAGKVEIPEGYTGKIGKLVI